MADSNLTLSWSRLKAYEACPQQVLRQMQRKQTPTRLDGRVFFEGSVSDRCMRAWLEEDDPQPGGMLTYVDKYFEDFAFNDEQYRINWRGNPAEDMAKARAKIERVLTGLEPILLERVIPRGYVPELRFGPPRQKNPDPNKPRATIGVPGLDGKPRPVDLVGGIDILTKTLDEQEDYEVLDLKATENDNYVRGDILAQPIFYAIAVRAFTGKYPKSAAFLTPACKEKVVPVTISEQDIRHMMSRIVNYCHGVWKKEWHPKDKPDSDCHYRCDVRHACDLFKQPTEGPKLTFAEMAERRRRN